LPVGGLTCAVEAGAAELALVRPLVAVDVHVLAEVRLRVEALRRHADLALTNKIFIFYRDHGTCVCPSSA
jgi:hypothetical protein